MRIKAFAKSEMVRTKTDRIDAALIGWLCDTHAPDPWTQRAGNPRPTRVNSSVSEFGSDADGGAEPAPGAHDRFRG
jgi:hypothetical protein